MEKLNVYKEFPCKWLEFVVNGFWPFLMAVNVFFILMSLVSWTSTSLAILIPCVLQLVMLIVADVLIRDLDKTGYVMWYIGNAAPLVGNLLSVILLAVTGVNAMNGIDGFGSVLSAGITTIWSALYGSIAFINIDHFLILFVVNCVYIRGRKNLFMYSYKKLSRMSARSEDTDF